MEKIKLLPEVFTKKYVNYRRLYQNEILSIYECQSKHEIYFEVFKRILSKSFDRFSSHEGYDLIENYPSDESFGKWAWCCSNKKSLQNMLKKHFNFDEEILLKIEDEMAKKSNVF